jgi:hypothetical protein
MHASPTRSRAALARAGTGLAVLLATFALPAAARAAGDFHVYAGSLPDGTAVAAGPWAGLNDNANGVGTFGMTLSGARRDQQTTGTLSPPANLTFTSATVNRRFDLPAGSDHTQPRAQTSWDNLGFGFTGASEYGGYRGDYGFGTLAASYPGTLSIRLACLSLDGQDGTCATSVYRIERLDAVLHDDEAPTVSGPLSGPLVDGGWQTTAASQLNVTAADLGSGVYRAFVREGTQTYYALADSAATRCHDARPGTAYAYEFVASAQSLVPCATATRTYTPTFDLTPLGDGTHVVSVGIEDAGGNERTVLTNRTLKVNLPGGSLGDPGTACGGGGTYDAAGDCQVGVRGGDGAGGAGTVTPVGPASASAAPVAAVTSPVVVAPVPPAADTRAGNGTGASADASLTLRVDGQATRHVTVGYGQQLVVSGRLAGRGDTPIGGATITISAVRGRERTEQAPVVTAGDGSFRAAIGAGASRTLHFAYRAFADDGDDADSADLEIGVRTGAHLTASPRTLRNGQAVQFRGRVDGPPARSTKVVEMQVHQDGRWLTFATTRLRKGHFGYRYRFSRTTTATRYVFRTIVRSEAGWPYETGTSNHVAVQVRP